MRTCLLAAAVAMSLTTLPASGASPLSGTSFEIKVLHAGAQDTRTGCVTFDATGRFAIAGRRGSMVWAQVPEFPAQFLAVSSPLNGTGVQIFVGVHGELRADQTLVARGIDETGASFLMTGTARKDCSGLSRSRAADTSATDDAAINPDLSGVYGAVPSASCASSICDPAADPLRAPIPTDVIRQLINLGAVYGPSNMPCNTYHCDPHNLLRSQDPSTTPSAIIDLGTPYLSAQTPCAISFCDPALNPLGANPGTQTRSSLAGQSFALTLGSGSRVIESCWTFTSDREVVTANGAGLVWSDSNSGNRGASFQSVGAARDGGGMAYNGELQGNLLRVTGIEARDGKAMVAEGWGQPVAKCANRL